MAALFSKPKIPSPPNVPAAEVPDVNAPPTLAEQHAKARAQRRRGATPTVLGGPIEGITGSQRRTAIAGKSVLGA